ncbi:MAG: D-alanyl-D-alanine carboxypeptidase [Oscillospiraceae bacterium]|jgi:D-alanyl-D-alanine carboxypeptidase (penicillin-binding protein 5/6)|nr:D-alanyl-D-alanine carboxypeptidase [Oscillospiraceae bacterium]
MQKVQKKQKMKKIVLSFLLIAVMLSQTLIPIAAAFNTLIDDIPGLTGKSEIILLLSLTDGSVVFSQNETKRTAPASLTKITTAILALEHCKNLDEKITVKAYTIRMFDGLNSSNAGIKPGEILTVEELLYCLLLPSANEAAAILADYVSGNIDDFVALMNTFAAKIGCADTHFANPHGLDQDGHYTTAADIAKIIQYALNGDFAGNAVFEKIVDTLRYTIPQTNLSSQRLLTNTNKMMNPGYADYYCEDVTGIKTGNTNNAGDCITAKASRNGYSFLCVVMKGQTVNIDNDPLPENTAFVDARVLLNWSFEHLRLRKVATTDIVVGEVPVLLARNTDRVQLVPQKDVNALVPEGLNEGSVLIEPIAEAMPQSVEAPIRQGDVIGMARIMYAGEEFARVPLVAAKSVSRSASLYFLSLAKQATQHPLAKILLFLILFSAALLVGVFLLRKYTRRKQKQLHIVPEITRKK